MGDGLVLSRVPRAMPPSHPDSVHARHAIRDHLRPALDGVTQLPHLEGVRESELRQAHTGVGRAMSSIRTELAVLSDAHTTCGHEDIALRLEKEFLALSMRLEDLLELARLRLDDGAVQLEPLMLDQAVRSALEDPAASLRAHGVQLDVQTQNDVPVTGDLERIREIAVRFLDLGVRCFDAGGRLQLRVVARDGRGRLELEAPGLEDGIDSSVGLRVCRTIAAALGGRLDGPDGDRLSFSLPLRSMRRRLPTGVADLRFL